MSNTPSDNLFKLIKSLSKPEKRYYKVYTAQRALSNNKSYQQLFDAINDQDVYDEEKIIEMFKNEALSNRISIAKSRLYQSILKSLENYYSKSSVEAQLKRQIHHVEILFNKSLYDQSYKLLKSIKKTALKEELTTSIMEISIWEKRLIERANYENVSTSDLDKLKLEDAEIVNKMTIYNNLWNVKSRIFKNMYSKGKIRTKDQLEKFKSIIDEAALKYSEESMFAENEYLLNHIYSAYHYGVSDYKESYEAVKKNITLIENKLDLFKDDPNVYISVLTNGINLATQLGEKAQAFLYLKKLKEVPKKLDINLTEDRAIRFFAIAKSTELNLCIEAKEYDRGIKLIPEIEKGLLKYDNKLTSVRKASFYFSIASLYFEKEKHNEALKWINQLLNHIEIDQTLDLHCMARIFNLILHIELDNKSLLPYILKSTERYLETRKRVYKFETLFLKFVRVLLRKRRRITTQDLFKNLAKDTAPLREDPFESRAFEYFDFYKWIEYRASIPDPITLEVED